MSEAHQVSPIQRDAFKDLVRTYAHEIVATQTFADMFREALENHMDSLADDMAERVNGAIIDALDPEDIVQDSGILNEISTQLEDMVRDQVQNISL